MAPPPSFDLLAPIYQLLERVTFGGLLHRCRTAHLDRLAGCRRALILGDGDGRFLADLLHANPSVCVDSVDISPGMVHHARHRLARIARASERVRFIVADARSVPLADDHYDLIVTNFFLDCFPVDELEQVIDRVVAACGPAAIWVDGDFRFPAGGWARVVAGAALAAMYAFFRLTTRLPARQLTDPAPFQVACGFHQEAERVWLGGFLSARLWAREIAASGSEKGPARTQGDALG